MVAGRLGWTQRGALGVALQQIPQSAMLQRQLLGAESTPARRRGLCRRRRRQAELARWCQEQGGTLGHARRRRRREQPANRYPPPGREGEGRRTKRAALAVGLGQVFASWRCRSPRSAAGDRAAGVFRYRPAATASLVREAPTTTHEADCISQARRGRDPGAAGGDRLTPMEAAAHKRSQMARLRGAALPGPAIRASQANRMGGASVRATQANSKVGDRRRLPCDRN